MKQKNTFYDPVFDKAKAILGLQIECVLKN